MPVSMTSLPHRKGFTLVELLVAISIIAILTAILLPNFMGAREKARDAQKIQDLNAVKNALRMYYNDNQIYPAGSACTTCLTSSLEADYMPGIAGVGYTYTQTNSGDGFQLCIPVEAESGNDEAYQSQLKCNFGGTVCGQSIGVTGVFVVCGN